MFIKSNLCFVVFFASIVLTLNTTNCTPLFAGESILLDAVVARVNNTLVTISDIEKTLQFFPLLREKNEPEQLYFRRILNLLIDHRVIYLEYSAEETLNADDLENVQLKVIKSCGSLENLKNLLKRWDMNWEDYLNFIREYAFFEKILRKKLKKNLFVSYQEIEDYYNQTFLPTQKEMGIEPRPLTEIAGMIEDYLLLKKLSAEQQILLNRVREKYEIEIYFSQ